MTRSRANSRHRRIHHVGLRREVVVARVGDEAGTMGVGSVRSVLVMAVLLCGVPRAAGARLPDPWSSYHTTDEILSDFSRMAEEHPRWMRWERVGDRVDVATITDSEEPDDDKARLLLVFGEHARELITAELALWLARVLVEEGAEYHAWTESETAFARSLGLRPPVMDGEDPTDATEWVRWLRRRCVVKIVPIEVPASREAVEQGRGCMRKTVDGVDLNRNWPVGFQPVSASKRATSEEYPGERPFSEVESRVVRDLARSFAPHGYANVHSGEWAVYVPWDHKPEFAQSLPADTSALLDRLNQHCECVVGAAGQVSGYLAYGTSMDYLYQELKTPYPLTFELWGENGEGKRQTSRAGGGGMLRGNVASARSRSAGRRLAAFDKKADACVKMFNPSRAEEYRGVIADWVNAVLVFADHLAGRYFVESRSRGWTKRTSVGGAGTEGFLRAHAGIFSRGRTELDPVPLSPTSAANRLGANEPDVSWRRRVGASFEVLAGALAAGGVVAAALRGLRAMRRRRSARKPRFG